MGRNVLRTKADVFQYLFNMKTDFYAAAQEAEDFQNVEGAALLRSFAESIGVVTKQMALEMDSEDKEPKADIRVGSVVIAEGDYLEGMVSVNGVVYPFDYNTKTENVEVHSYSAPGWLSGSSYEMPLPKVVVENMEEIDCAIMSAVEAFLEKTSGTLEDRLANATAKASQAKDNKTEQELQL